MAKISIEIYKSIITSVYSEDVGVEGELGSITSTATAVCL